ncbi:MAG: TetR family transcriptional regulator [Streptosporangiales bacterium]|nr:TetR family transcriptional regulator [Streptosporangiales bacterium]
MADPARPVETRSARKRRAILEAATTLFLRNGYQGTSMDEVAAMAAVSKQTVYKHFADKERLFTDIILSVSGSIDELLNAEIRALADSDDLERDLRTFARRHVRSITQPRVVRLRRLVISVADRFPALGRTFWERGPERVISGLADSMDRLHRRGLLKLDDPHVAASQFAYLVVSGPLDRTMFWGEEEEAALTEEALHRAADAGVRAFLAAYGTGRPAG